MEKNSIKAGLKFKPKYNNNNSVYGVITEVKNNYVYFHWIDSEGIEEGCLLLSEVIACFEYYGWIVLSSLEEELL